MNMLNWFLIQLFDLTAENVKEFSSDSLLSEFIVFKLKLITQFLSIVVGTLHSHHAGSLFGGTVLHEHLLKGGEEEQREYGVENGIGTRFKEVRTRGLRCLTFSQQVFLNYGEKLLGERTLA